MYVEEIKLSVEYAAVIGKALSTLSEASAAKVFAADTMRRAHLARSGKELFALIHSLDLPELAGMVVTEQCSPEVDQMLATGVPPSVQEARKRLSAMVSRLQAGRGSWSEDAGDGALTGAAVGGALGGLVGGTVGSMAGALAGGVGGAVGGAINHAMGWKALQATLPTQ
jgi:hypothetical protein